MKIKLVFLVVFLVLSACSSAPPAQLALPRNLPVSALVGQMRQASLEVTNLGGSPLEYALSETADWLDFTDTPAGRLEPGGAATVAFTANCPERASTLQTTLTVASDAPTQPSATTQITLTCAETLEPGEEGFVAALGTWNWSASDDAALGSSLLLGFRYLQAGTVTVSVKGPPGWNGDASRQLVLPSSTFADDAPSEDVWTYDLLTHTAETPLAGVYRVTATTDRGDSYTLDLTLDSSRFVQSPKNITVTPLAEGVSVTWTPVAGANAYYVIVTDPTAEVRPQGGAASGLSVLTVPSYARDFTKATRLQLAAALTPAKRYQVTVVAFTSDLVLGGSEAETLAVEATPGFDSSSAAQQFTYAP